MQIDNDITRDQTVYSTSNDKTVRSAISSGSWAILGWNTRTLAHDLRQANGTLVSALVIQVHQ